MIIKIIRKPRTQSQRIWLKCLDGCAGSEIWELLGIEAQNSGHNICMSDYDWPSESKI